MNNPSATPSKPFDFHDYGKLLHQYVGRGTTVLGGGTKINSNFQLIQFSDGRIFLYAFGRYSTDTFSEMKEVLQYQTGNADDLDELRYLRSIGHFEGVSSEGLNVIIEKMVFVRMQYNIQFDDDHIELAMKFICDNAKITSSGSYQVSHIRFFLTNFEFIGTESYSIQLGETTIQSHMKLLFDLKNQEVSILPVPDYDDVIRELAALQSVDITCFASINITDLSETAEASRIIDDVCTLLTLARSTLITWICYSVESDNGRVLQLVLHRTKTKRFEGDGLISPYSAEATKRLVELGLPRLERANTEWNFVEVLDLYTDAKVTVDSIKSRALKTVICLEIAKAGYINRRQNGDSILPTPIFRKLRDKLKTFIQELSIADSELLSFATDNLDNKLSSLNRASFNSLLREMMQELDYPISTDKLTRFVKTRNDLVHSGIFPMKYGSIDKQLEFLQELVGQFLLGIVGYYSSDN